MKVHTTSTEDFLVCFYLSTSFQASLLTLDFVSVACFCTDGITSRIPPLLGAWPVSVALVALCSWGLAGLVVAGVVLVAGLPAGLC